MAYIAKQRKQILSLSKRLLGRRNIARIREFSFRLTHQIKGFPHLRKDVLTQVDEESVLINCRLLDPRDQVKHISLCFGKSDFQCIDETLVHYRTSATSLSKTILSPQANDRFAGLVKCKEDPSRISGIKLSLVNGKQRVLKNTRYRQRFQILSLSSANCLSWCQPRIMTSDASLITHTAP